MIFRSAVLIILAVSFAPTEGWSRQGGAPKAVGADTKTPEQLKDIGISERLGQTIDLANTFVDEDGATVTLGKYFNSKPVLLSIAYYGCPSLCGFHLNGLTAMMKNMTLKAGPDYEFVVVSMDHSEGPSLAAPKKANYITELGQPEAAPHWHFLTGSEENIKRLADQVGFSFRWDDKEKQYAHASAAYVMTPTGKISRYLYGIDFDPKTVRLSMVEASEGKIGSIVDRLILFCFHYDPLKSKYAIMANNIVKIGGALMLLILGALLIPFWIRQRREQQRVRGEVP